MANEKPLSASALSESTKKLTIYSLPTDIFLNISQFFSLKTLGEMRLVSKFFSQLFPKVIFATNRGMALLKKTFSTLPEQKILTKKFLYNQIEMFPQRANISDVSFFLRLSPAEFTAIEEKILLKNTSFYNFPFYPTALLNKIALKNWFETKSNYLGTGPRKCDVHSILGTDSMNFIVHCILHRLNVLPNEAEAKKTLECAHTYFYPPHDYIWDNTLPRRNFLILSLQKLDKATLNEIQAAINPISLQIPMDSLTDSVEDCTLRTTLQLEFELSNTLTKEGSIKDKISADIAMFISLTNPIKVAWYLLNAPTYFGEQGFEESCEFLLTEIEKFRGFPDGITDEELNELKVKLEEIKRNGKTSQIFIDTQRVIKQTIQENSAETYSEINQVLDDFQRTMITSQSNKNYFQKICIKMRFQAAIDTIEEKFKKNFSDKPTCQAEFIKVINSDNLTVAQKAELFTLFKDRIELNRHQNPRLDKCFGIKNTTSWRATWEKIRNNAKQKLFSEVDELGKDLRLPQQQRNHKEALLKWAKFHPLFCDHRNNTVLKGAFGRTQAVIDIDEKLSMMKTEETIAIRALFL